MRRLVARHVLLEGEFVEGVALDIEGERITAVHRGGAPDDGVPARDLGEVALVPGLVNAHSHAFQRDIRGRTEWLHRDRADEDFWSWRREMYSAALSYSADDLERVARRAFWEMALTGVTAVGEFHYIHHQPDGTPYEDANELAHRVIRAAREVGVRIALLRVAYHRAGYDRPADSMQRRFVEPDVEVYLERLAALEARWRGEPGVSVGAAPHSIRAVPGGWLEAIGRHAAAHGMPLHIHACEQRAEIAQSVAEYGRTPLEVFDDLGLFEARPVLVHATHLSARELDLLAERDAIVCACPTTERNLGDGFLPALALVERGVPICVGSDSHTSIDLWEEVRLVEYHERLRYERRNVLARAWPVWFPALSGVARRDVARLLWPMGSAHGAAAIGLEAGRIAPGQLADLVALDLEHPSLLGADAGSLLSDVTLSMKTGAVRDVFVGGAPIVEGGRHVRLAPGDLAR